MLLESEDIRNLEEMINTAEEIKTLPKSSLEDQVKVVDNREIFEGYWQDGLQSGKGRLLKANGDIFDGEWSYGNLMEGNHYWV